MNPFLHSTVAVPLATGQAGSWLAHRPASHREAAAPPQSHQPTPGGQARARWCRTVRSLALAAGLGLAACQGASAQNTSVNANIATADQLQSIKGIGPKTAQTIVQERERSGPFESFQDFAERIRGIGPKKARSLREAGLTVSSGRPASPGEALAVR